MMVSELTNNLFSDNTGDKLFIFGNGFDINLGFPTKYEDFFKSNQFPFVHNDSTCHTLGHYVYEKGYLQKWYDLENLLAEYGSGIEAMSLADVQGDKEDYLRLVESLADYLRTIDFKHPSIDSIAARVLRAADDQLVPPTIYSFNYTDFEPVSKALGINYSEVRHVHGSLKNGDIVLGVGEYVKLGPNASYLHKTSSIAYNSSGILSALETHDTIIIFGLSLSQVDYPYFEDFFRDVSYRKYTGERKKYIGVFTYDEMSRLEILDIMRSMNSGLIKLMGYCDFDIIRTMDDSDYLKVEEVIEHLSKHCKVGV